MAVYASCTLSFCSPKFGYFKMACHWLPSNCSNILSKTETEAEGMGDGER